jgi:hypothetical protein
MVPAIMGRETAGSVAEAIALARGTIQPRINLPPSLLTCTGPQLL